MNQGDAVSISSLGKRYKLYRRTSDKIFDAFGIHNLLFWRKNYYQEFWALRDFNLRIRRGERVGLIGRNGAGKSTLLKIIAGTVSPTEGNAQVSGSVQALMELGTGFHPEFTGRENIRAALALQGRSTREIRELEAEIVDFAELDDFIEQPLKTYSAGMSSRLGFSVATAILPEILIIDEVLGAGDAYFMGKCIERMRHLTEASGATVLFVSHGLESVQELCNRAVWIDRGRIRRDGEPLAVIKEYSAIVRRDEEVRLRARDQKLLRKQAQLMENESDLFDTLLFHFAPVGEHWQEPKASVYEIKLLVDGEAHGVIEPGQPMDNSAGHGHHLMDTPGFMDWGQPRKNKHGVHRPCGDHGGRYGHAPFEFRVPKSVDVSHRQLELQVTYSSENPLALEVYNGQGYARLQVLGPQAHGDVSVSFGGDVTRATAAQRGGAGSPGDAATSAPPEPSKPQGESEYGSGQARITAVRLVGTDGGETKVLEVGQPLEVVVEFEAFEPLEGAVFVFCVYHLNGKCATQFVRQARDLGAEVVTGTGRAIFRIERLLLGRSSYVASAAIFKGLPRRGIEAESYHVLDRCIHFVVQQAAEDASELGLCVQPFEARLVQD